MFFDIKNQSVVFDLIIVAIVVHMEEANVTKAGIKRFKMTWSLKC